MRLILSIILFFASANCFSQNKITVTIDDLPCTHCESIDDSKEVNKKLIETLKMYKVPAIGFVNENKLYTDEKPDQSKIDILREWLKNDLNLGNHTFSHIYINNTTIEQYEEDLLKGEIITRPLTKKYNKELKYFRHTQLRTGPTPEFKAQLDKVLVDNNYITAPVTIDNDEYIYAYCYHEAKMNDEEAQMRLIAYDYIDYMKSIFQHYERTSKEFLGYNVNQILLLHANELNADYLPFLLDILKNKRYSFTSLDEALKDSAYQLPESYSTRGLSWINRWQLAKGETFKPHPPVSSKIQALYEHYANDADYQKHQVFNGNESDIEAIQNRIEQFSTFYIAKEYENLAQLYTIDGKIFPDKTGIIEGRDAIKKRWVLPQDRTVTSHIVTPVEIQVVGNTAYDYGYFEGQTTFSNGKSSRWNGKYVIVWKKVENEWKIYLDIWNRL